MKIGQYIIDENWQRLQDLIGTVDPARTYKFQNVSGTMIYMVESDAEPAFMSIVGNQLSMEQLAYFRQGAQTLWVRGGGGANKATIYIHDDR